MKELSTKELIEKLNTEEPEPSKPTVRSSSALKKPHLSVVRFILDFGLESGDVRVPNFLIYFLYHRKFKSTVPKLKKTAFFRNFNRYFKNYRNGLQRFYMLNDKKLISDERIEVAREYSEYQKKYENQKKGKK